MQIFSAECASGGGGAASLRIRRCALRHPRVAPRLRRTRASGSTRNGAQLDRFHDPPPAPRGPAMTFFSSRSPWSDHPGKSFSPGGPADPFGDTRREEDAERPVQTAVLVRKPTVLHAKETSMPRMNLVDPATATGARSRCSMRSRAPSARRRTCFAPLPIRPPP
jgi:hypothetical protein